MQTYLAFPRAINVGGHAKIAMGDLRDFLTVLGFIGAKTLLQSGNLAFGSEREIPDLAELLAREAKSRLGLETDFLTRTQAEWQALIAANPFPAEAKQDPSHLLVVLLDRVPTNAAIDALKAAIKGSELVTCVGREAYVVYPDGIARSRLTLAVIEKMLGRRGTGRNWNTVLKLADLAASISS
jgi:uncharacterized protein (DUF1697 family)